MGIFLILVAVKINPWRKPPTIYIIYIRCFILFSKLYNPLLNFRGVTKVSMFFIFLWENKPTLPRSMYEIFIYIWPPVNLNVSFGYWNYDPLITKKNTHRKLLVPKFPNAGERETRLADNPPPTSWSSSSALFSTMWLDHLAGKNGKMNAHHDSFHNPAKKIST